MNKAFKRSKLCIFCIFVLVIALVCGSMVFSSAEESGSSGKEGWDLDEIVMKKSISLNEKAPEDEYQTYQLTVDTYVKGSVAWHESYNIAPYDVVMVLDTSGSMDDSMGNGDKTTRLSALKTAAKKFIAELSGSEDTKDPYGKYKTGDYRVAIVDYSSTSSTKVAVGWTPLNKDGVTTLNTAIGNLSAGGSTAADEGMKKAKALLTTDYTVDNANIKTGRNKIVILFTDGAPNHDSDFDVTVANTTISTAYDLKEAGITVFSVGIFGNARASELYATSQYYSDFDYYATTGAVGEYWQSDSETQADYAACNRFMNYVSSNYKTPKTVGLSFSHDGWLSWYNCRYTITEATPTRSEGDFYYTAKTTTDLVDSFINISKWVAFGGTTVQLDETSVVKDVISSYFELPEGTTINDITTYYAACTGVDEKGEFTFGTPVATKGSELFPNVEIELLDYKVKGDNRVVQVTGFDYSTNYVAYDSSTKRAHGYKLLIVFNIKSLTDFSGGNNVPTNEITSGIYEQGSDTPVKPYNQPTVDVEIPAPTGEVVSKTVLLYQGNGVTIDRVMEVIDIEDPVNDAYIKRTVKVNGVEINKGVLAPEHTTYYPTNIVEVILEPKYEPSGVGTEAVKKSAKNIEDFTIYVKEPTVNVTLNDVEGYYGESYTLGSGTNASWTVDWSVPGYTSDPTTDIVDTDVPFTASDISMEYTSTGYSGKLPKHNLSVKVDAKFNSGVFEGIKYVSDKATVKYVTTCTHGCSVSKTDATYLVHVKTASLTINHSGGSEKDYLVYNIKKDGVKYASFTMQGGKDPSSITIKGLPVGSYTVEADEDWGYKYDVTFKDSKSTATLSSTNPTDTISIEVSASSDEGPRGPGSDRVVNEYGNGSGK